MRNNDRIVQKKKKKNTGVCGKIILIFSVAGLLAAAAFVWLLTVYKKVDNAPVAFSEVLFSDHSFEDEGLYLFTEDEPVTYILNNDALSAIDADMLLDDCENHVFKVGYKNGSELKTPMRYVVSLRRITGDEYLRPGVLDEIARRRYAGPMYAAAAVFAVSSIITGAALCVVGIRRKNR